MSWRTLQNSGLLVLVAIYVANEREVSAQTTMSPSKERVVITIHPESMVDSPEVLVSDVARIDSRDSELKARIAVLDVADAPRSNESAIITSSRIEFRLRLAGIDIRRVTILGEYGEILLQDTGIRNPMIGDRHQGEIHSARNEMMLARATSIPSARNSRAIRSGESREKSITSSKGTSIRANERETRSAEEMVVFAARRCILEQLPWAEDEISIRLVQPVGRDVQAIEHGKSALYTAEVLRSGPPVGRVQVEVTVEGADSSTIAIPVTLDVRHYDNVVAATKPIPRGREIQLEDLYVHRWDVTGSTDYCSDPRKLVGKIARHPIPALQIIRDQELESSASSQERSSPVVIKRQDRVKLVAKIGSLNITVSGESQQEGRVGDMIRVQNLESKSIVQGRVLGPSEVEIIY